MSDAWVTEPCRLCGAKLDEMGAPVLTEVGRYGEDCRVVCCSVCGLAQRSPMPTEEELATYYRDEYRKVHVPLPMQWHGRQILPPHDGGAVAPYEAAHDARAKQHVHEHHETRPAIIHSLGLRPGHRVLEIGCGDGRVAAELMDAGIDVVAIEPDDECRQAALDRGVECYADMVGLGFDFDGAVMVHSLEHMREPIAILRTVRRALKPRRRVYIELPNLAYPYGQLAWFFQAPHLYTFGPDQLAAVMHCAGFDLAAKLVSGSALWGIGESMGEDRPWESYRMLWPERVGAWWQGYLTSYQTFVGSREGR